MSKNNPQYEDSIEGRKGEIVVARCGITVQIRCIDDIEATSVFLYHYQIQKLITQLEDAAKEARRKAYGSFSPVGFWPMAKIPTSVSILSLIESI